MKMKLRSYFTYLFLFTVLVCCLSACSSYKHIPYLQSKDGKDFEVPSLYKENTIRYQPDDVLGITVNIIGEPTIASDFNLPLQPVATNENSSTYVNTGIGRQTYMVDKEGNIDFPVLGIMKVAGYTQAELENEIKNALHKYLKAESVITVRLLSFRVYVLGEVNRPGEHIINRDHANILDVLAQAGDMTIFGKRNEVQIIRELPDGSMKKVTIDISKADVITSPYFYLHQNDVLYVVPNSSKRYSADIGNQTYLWFTIISSLMSVSTWLIYMFDK